MHGKCAIWRGENVPQRPGFVGKRGVIPPPQGIGSLFRNVDLPGYGRILSEVTAGSLVSHVERIRTGPQHVGDVEISWGIWAVGMYGSVGICGPTRTRTWDRPIMSRML